MAILYLKKKTDIDNDGNYNYTTNCYLFDNKITEIDLDTPKKKITVRKKIGNGQSITMSDFYEARNIKINLRFKAETGETSFFNDSRLTFLKTWITSDDEMYLVRYYNNTTYQAIRVYPTGISNEKLTNYRITGNITVELLTESPFFCNTTQSTNAFILTGGETLCQVINNGVRCPFQITIQLYADTDGIIIKLYENVQIQLTDYFFNGQTVYIDMADMTMQVNGADKILTVVGSPFNLVTGINNLTVRTDGDSDVDINYCERFL